MNARRALFALLLAVSGADAVAVTPRGVLRFSERSSESGRLDNSRPARFVHVDVSDATAAVFATQANPHPERSVRRFCQYNVWRAFSSPPQDAPLAVCDARSVEPADLMPADAVFDVRERPSNVAFKSYVRQFAAAPLAGARGVST